MIFRHFFSKPAVTEVTPEEAKSWRDHRGRARTIRMA